MSFFIHTPKTYPRPTLLTPLDLLVGLLWQPIGQRDGVTADLQSARRNRRK